MARALGGAGRDAGDIAAIGLTTQRASCMVWDKAGGAPLSPLVIWSDLRGAARAVELAAAGFMLAPQQAATKLPSILAAIEAPRDRLAFGNIDSYLIWRLTGGGAHVTDRSQAWPSGYLSLADLAWNGSLAAFQGLEISAFPRLVDTWGWLGDTAPALFGRAIPITADIADQQSALLAHGDVAGTAKITFGTSATFDLATGGELLFPAPSLPPLIVSSVEGVTRFCVEGMVLAAGSALDWLRAVCALGGPTKFDVLADQADDAGAVAFLPALQGLGAPHGDPARRGLITGLSGATTRGQIARAGMDGVAFRAREVFDRTFALLARAPPESLRVDGGLTRSPVFLRRLAGALGRPIERHATAEATLLGAAMAAGRGAGVFAESDIQAMIRYDAPVSPGIGTDEAAARFAAWRDLVYGQAV
jgi:glycerol kinase